MKKLKNKISKLNLKWLFLIPIGLLLLAVALPISVQQSNKITLEGQIEIGTVPYFSEVTGKVIEDEVNLGQWIEVGDELLVIDDQTTQNLIRELETEIIKIKQNLVELGKGATSSEYQTAANNIEISREQMFNAQTNYLLAIDAHEKGQTYVQESKMDDLDVEGLKAKKENEERIFKIAELEFDNAVQASKQLSADNKEKIVVAQANLKLWEEKLSLAKVDLQKYRIKAHNQGYVIGKNVQWGSMVTTGETVLEISKENEKYAVFYVPEEFLEQISYGDKVLISSKNKDSDGKIQEYEGEVKYVDLKAQYTPKEAQNSSNQNKITFKVKVLLPANTPWRVAQKVLLTIER